MRVARRRLLGIAATGPVLSSGCLEAVGDPVSSALPVRFCAAWVSNRDRTDAHHVRIQLLEDTGVLSPDRVVRAEAEAELAAYDPRGVADRAFVTADDLPAPDPRRRYAFRVAVDRGEWRETDLTTWFQEPVRVAAKIDSDGEVGIRGSFANDPQEGCADVQEMLRDGERY